MSQSPLFDRQTSPQADARCTGCPPIDWQYFTGQPIGNLDNEACLLDPPLILWDQITQRNCVVLDCFSSRMFEDTTYWLLEAPGAYIEAAPKFWRQDYQVEEQAIFHGYDAGELCKEYLRQYSKPYKGSAASIKAIIEVLFSRKADVGRRRDHIGDISDMIVRAMNWKEEGGLGYE